MSRQIESESKNEKWSPAEFVEHLRQEPALLTSFTEFLQRVDAGYIPVFAQLIANPHLISPEDFHAIQSNFELFLARNKNTLTVRIMGKELAPEFAASVLVQMGDATRLQDRLELHQKIHVTEDQILELVRSGQVEFTETELETLTSMANTPFLDQNERLTTLETMLASMQERATQSI